ncbi:MAG: AAA domain-containing protein [Calditrichaeota bacterium]|nr:AAA domain-containing protein [Calditrichota bacterium]
MALETFLNDKKFGVAHLSSGLDILWHNTFFPDFTVSGQSGLNLPLKQVLPELIGMETVLQEIASGKRQRLYLENLVREKPDGREIYFNLFVYPPEEKDAFLTIILEDQTEKTRHEQRLLQQTNEIRLLESLLESRGEYASRNILGRSPAIRAVRKMIAKVASVPSATVLLQGESGTGKNLVARVIHYSSQEAKAPFVEINCAAIPEALLESELFGYEKGAFTNAATGKPGLLEEADGGTLFLDEISQMSLKLQAKLLSFLESRRFRRLGSTQEIEVRLRLLAATNQNLADLVEEKQFREDLFYRLNVVWINLPPLRELGEDLLEIAHHFIDLFNRDFNKHVRGLAPEAREKLLAYPWPGNVRELRNVLERAMIFAEGDVLEADDVLIQPQTKRGSTVQEEIFHLPAQGVPLEEVEKKLLLDAIRMSHGNQSRAARLLHLSRDTFRYRLKKHGLMDVNP